MNPPNTESSPERTGPLSRSEGLAPGTQTGTISCRWWYRDSDRHFVFELETCVGGIAGTYRYSGKNPHGALDSVKKLGGSFVYDLAEQMLLPFLKSQAGERLNQLSHA